MKKSTLFTLLLILLITGLLGVYTYTVHTSPEAKIANSQAGEALVPKDQTSSYTDLEGNPIRLTDYGGNVLVVNSWASWSPYTRDDLTNLNQIASDFAVDGVVVMAINRQEDTYAAERFMRTLPEYQSIIFALDPTDHFYHAIEGRAMPETVVFDRKGEQVLRFRGPISPEAFGEALSEVVTNN